MRFCVVGTDNWTGPRLARQVEGGLAVLSARDLHEALLQWGQDGLLERAAGTTEAACTISAVTRWYPPVLQPPTFRDFYAFEQHVRTCRAQRGQDVAPEWYEVPVFYFSNPCSLTGHLEPVRRPAETRELDYELEIGAILGRAVKDIHGPAAEDAILGYTILNDLSARDLQRQEMRCLLGPAKGKDFATAVGPWVVTPDELDDHRVRPGKYQLSMVARRNGQELSRGNFADIHWDFTQMIQRASAGVTLRPGDLIGSGTVGTGCILELTPEVVDGWLQPGDTIELEIEHLGTLSTPII